MLPGYVQVYERMAGSWTPVARIVGLEDRNYFGWDVDLEGDTLMVGAVRDGEVHFYERDANGFLGPTSRPSGRVFLTAATARALLSTGTRRCRPRRFGNWDNICPPSEVHFYERDANGWHQVATLLEPGVTYDQWFQQVRISGVDTKSVCKNIGCFPKKRHFVI